MKKVFYRTADHSRNGVALVVVMITVALVVTLAVAFLSSVTTERSASSSFKASVQSRQLADTAMNIVLTQIRAGTGQGANVAWTSQPGLIRTFDNTGMPKTNFKLYSATVMQVTGTFSRANAQSDVPSDWFSRKDEFTDLNAPITRDGVKIYPIVDPTADGMVEGFNIATTAPVSTTAPLNAAPMPAGWLYVLQDGTVAAYNSPLIKKDNPPVGRIAFWTDDESAKINLNTASEGVFWDSPRAISTYETDNLAKYQPANGEYQRYPGHPAMNCLSPVLGKLLFSKTDPISWTDYLSYYQIAPRIPVSNTSQAGTTSILSSPTGATAKDERLFPTVDELIFDKTRNLVASTSLSNQVINIGKFFLTTNSRAPDVTLFNRPRVLIWPLSINTTSDYRTALDNLIAFCGTINGFPYYFQRQDPKSESTDLPGTVSASGLGRNRMLMNYLRSLTDNAIPGFGGNFLSKYGSDRDQILTEIFDYIRCTNLEDTTATSLKSYTPKNGTAGTGQVVPIYDGATDTRGFGRFPTVSEACVLFIAQDDQFTSATSSSPVAAGKIRIQAAFLPELFTAAMGYSIQTPDFGIRITGLDAFKWNGVSMGFTSPATTLITRANAAPAATTLGGAEGITYVAWGKNLNAAGGSDFPFFSATLDVTKASTFTFSGGDVKIEMLGPDIGGIRSPVQTLTLSFPSAAVTLPVPSGVITTLTSAGTMRAYNRFDARFAVGSQGRASITWITSKDVARSVRAGDKSGGDIRLIAARHAISATDSLFEPEPRYTLSTETLAHSLFTGIGCPYLGASRGKLVKDAAYFNSFLSAATTNDLTYTPSANSNSVAFAGTGGGMQQLVMDNDVPTNGVWLGGGTTGTLAGDWDNGTSINKDGPYINKVDEGDKGLNSSSTPYFMDDAVQTAIGPTLFSPNRQIPSAGMFGSLPTGVKSKRPWQTLLFHPDSTGIHSGNPGRGGDGTSLPNAPGDFLWLDLFHMPVVEPYAISEPLSTAGRINMNYQIIPYTYIKRETGIWSVLRSEKLLAIPTSAAPTYKMVFAQVNPATKAVDFRKNIDVTETLKGFQARFDNNDVFRAPSEICQLPLVPVGSTYTGMSSYWNSYPLTGDNSRERPYTDIYPRLTTRSNVYTIHFKVQPLTPLKSKAGYNPATDFIVTGEYRGSCAMERFIDPNNKKLPDFADIQNIPIGNAKGDINQYYAFRFMNLRQF